MMSTEDKSRLLTPRTDSSSIFFSWLNPIFKKGFSKTVLETSDLHELEEDNKAEHETEKLEKFWSKEKRNYSTPGQRPSLGRAVWKCYRKNLLHSALYTTIESASRIAQALLIGLLVTGLAQGINGPQGSRLLFYVPALCFATYSFVITLHRGQFLGKLYGMRLRIALTGLVYKKVFQLTQSSVAHFTSGHVINLVSNDVRKFDNFFRSFHYLWLAPLELVITTYLVWQMIGWLAIIASVYMLLFIPTLGVVGKLLGKLHLKISTLTDRRVRLTGEILNGIRAIKMYTWEKPLSDMIGNLRKLELKKIHWFSILQAGLVIIYFLTMVTLSLILYTALVMEGHLLTAQNVFSTMVLYSNIKHSLCGHFGLQMSYTLQGLASLKRIQSFLIHQEKHEFFSADNLSFFNVNYISDKSIQDVVPGTVCEGTFNQLFSPKVKTSPQEFPDIEQKGNDIFNVKYISDKAIRDVIPGKICDGTFTRLFSPVAKTSPQFLYFPPNDIEDIYNNDNNNNDNDNNNDDSNDDGSTTEKVTPFLSVENMTCYWSDDSTHACLRNINFNVSSGELLAVTGPVGSGKSSLLMSILGELCPAYGEIKQSGTVACAPQVPWLFTGTIQENILFGLPYDHKRYQETVETCQLVSDFKLFPNGDSTLIGERGISLSGGQRARVSLARAVYYNADIYLLDDPFSALDINVGKKLFEECVKGLLKSRLVILVTHHLSYLKEVDRIIFMKEGNMIADGSYKEIQRVGVDLSAATQTRKISQPQRAPATVIDGERPEENSEPVSEGLGRAEEGKATGAVPLSLYWKYFRTGNSTLSLVAVLVLFIATQVILKCSEWWLARWSDMPFEEQQNRSNIYIFAGLIGSYVILSFVAGLTHYKSYLNSNKCLHDNMVSSVIRSPVLFFDTNPVGRIQNRFSKDLGYVDEELPNVGFKFFFSTINCLGSVLVVAAVQYWSVIAAVPLLILFVLLGLYYIRTTREVKRLEATSRSPLYSHVSETLEGLTSIQAFEGEERFIKDFYSFQDEHTRAWFTYIAGGEWLGLRAELLTATFLATAAIIAVTSSADAGFTGLALYSAVNLTQIIYVAVHNSVQYETLMTSVERLLEYSELRPEPGYQVEAQPPTEWPQDGSISCKDLTFSYYEGGPNILKNVNFDIKAKEKIGIVGQTGSGKSSLLAALFRMPEAQGKILIDGQDISIMDLQSSRAAMSVIPQDPFLFSGELRKNLDPFNALDDMSLWQALERVQLKDKVQSLPGQLQYMLNESGWNLSVGERQLVCLARALLQQNRIIVIDEATANVDFETDRKIQETIKQNFSECTVLTIAHRLDTIMDSDRVMVLSGGTVTEYDSPQVLLGRKDSAFAQLVKQ